VSRNGGPALEQPIWLETSVERPCPTCGRTRGCGVIEDGEFVRCLGVVSPWPVAGGGWLHPIATAGRADHG
jgi:hypothetical protein